MSRPATSPSTPGQDACVQGDAAAARRVARRHFALTALGLLVLVALVYGRAVGFGFVDWDDDAYIVRNPLVSHPLAHGWRYLLLTPMGGYPQPLPVLTQHVDYRLAGGQPWAFHLGNLVLHAGNAMLLAVLLRRLGVRALVAFLGAALWAVHPLCAEPACWATGRKDLLATTLLLATLWLFRVWQERTPAARWTIGGMLLTTLLGLACKPTLVVVPVLLGLALLLLGPRPTRGMSLGLLVMVGLCSAVTAIAWVGQSHIHVVDGAAARPLALRGLFASQHLALQLRNWLAPVWLSAKYLEPLPQPVLSPWGAAGLLVVLLGLAALLAALRYGARLTVFGLAFLLVTFVPASGLAPLNRGVADVYFYVPSMALAGLLAALVDKLAIRLRTVVPALAGLVLAAGLLGFVQAGTWTRSSALWQRVWEKYPEHRSAWWAYADSLVWEGKLARGLAVYGEGIKHFSYPPSEPTSLISAGTGCLLLGDHACAAHWLGELVRHFGATLPNSLRLLAVGEGEPGSHADELRRAEATARAALTAVMAAAESERRERVRALLGPAWALDLPARRGLAHLARDPKLAPAVLLLLTVAAGGTAAQGGGRPRAPNGWAGE